MLRLPRNRTAMLALCLTALFSYGTATQAGEEKERKPVAAKAAPAAHPGGEHHEAMREHHEFHEHDVHRFNHADFARWRGGRWNNTCFAGRCGWWWFSGGQWYFYERPVYPYPLEVPGITYVEPVVVAAPVVRAAPAVQTPIPAAAAPQFWYYCDNPPGYYPYVATCNGQYREVPVPANAGATQPAPAAAQSAPAQPISAQPAIKKKAQPPTATAAPPTSNTPTQVAPTKATPAVAAAAPSSSTSAETKHARPQAAAPAATNLDDMQIPPPPPR